MQEFRYRGYGAPSPEREHLSREQGAIPPVLTEPTQPPPGCILSHQGHIHSLSRRRFSTPPACGYFMPAQGTRERLIGSLGECGLGA